MIYSIEQIKELVLPIAIKFKLKALWVFGSYARSQATEDSDVDFLLDYTDSILVSLLNFNHLDRELHEVLKKDIDLISTKALYNERFVAACPKFVAEVTKERIMIYEK
jgi:predicted nucleotidyltransferase